MNETVSDRAMTRFILGQLPVHERDRLEADLMVDDVLFERLLMVENDLIDRYSSSELSVSERACFERLLTSSSRLRERFELDRTLRAVAAEELPPVRVPGPRSLWTPFLAAAASLLLVVAGALLVGRGKPTDELQVAGRPVDAGERAVVSIDLFPGMLRSGANRARVEIPTGRGVGVLLRLDLETDQPYASYDARLETAGGRQIYREERLAPSRLPLGSVVELTVPAATLEPGGYLLILSRLTTEGEPELVHYYELEAAGATSPPG